MAAPAYIFDEPPFMAVDPIDRQRVDEQRRRRRLIYGGWGRDAMARMLSRIGSDRTDAWGEPNLTSNVFFSCVSALAVLYSEPPTIGNTIDPSAASDMAALTRTAGLWPLMQRYQRDTLAFREMLLRVDVARVANTGDPVRDFRPKYRPVFPDLCELVPDPEDPQRPIEIVEYRQRPHSGSIRWTKERWSLLGPIHQVSDGSVDISSDFGLPANGASGEAYPTRYRRADGSAVLPYVLHHAALTGCLLDPYCLSELVEATYEISVDWTFFGHCLRNAAFGRIVAIGCSPEAISIENGRNVAVSDPSVVHKFAKDADFDGQPTVKMLSQAVDAMNIAEAVGLEERKMAVFAGIDPSEFQRLDGDPRSGYAIAISQEGRRQAALRYGPVMEMGDAETLALTAMMINREMGAEVYPEEGWTLEYAPLAEPKPAPVPSTARRLAEPVEEEQR